MIKTQPKVTKRKTRQQKRKQTDQVSSCHPYKFVLTWRFTTVFLTWIRLGIRISLFLYGNHSQRKSRLHRLPPAFPPPHPSSSQYVCCCPVPPPFAPRNVGCAGSVVTVNKNTERNRPNHRLALACPCFCFHVLFW